MVYSQHKLYHLRRTYDYSISSKPILGIGQYAAVVDIGGPQHVAIATDTVGTKALVAQELGIYNTIGIDCVAMNVNDIICVGAEPISMVDTIQADVTEELDLDHISEGLREGARQAHISIVGGETANVPALLQDEVFDLGGTCIGLVEPDKILTGERIKSGDVLVGFASSGIHSNGFTLARQVFDSKNWGLDKHLPELGRTLGKELLEPTKIYVDLAMDLLRKVDVHAFFHITGDGFLNLQRVPGKIGWNIDNLPDMPPVFDVLQKAGGLGPSIMFNTFNMGIGFCAAVSEEDVEETIEAGIRHDIDASAIGVAVDSDDRIIKIQSGRINIKTTNRGFFG